MPMTNAERLRRKLGERIPPNGTDADTFFTDEEITDLLEEAADNLILAAAIGWADKLAELVKLVDRDDAGSSRKLSQMARNAKLMLDHYAGAAGFVGTTTEKARALGRSINLRDNGTAEQVMAASATHRMLENDQQLIRNSHPDVPEGYPAPHPEAT